MGIPVRMPAEQATVKCQNMDTFSSIPVHVISSEVRIVYVSIKGKSRGKVNNRTLIIMIKEGVGLPCEKTSGAGDRKVQRKVMWKSVRQHLNNDSIRGSGVTERWALSYVYLSEFPPTLRCTPRSLPWLRDRAKLLGKRWEVGGMHILLIVAPPSAARVR